MNYKKLSFLLLSWWCVTVVAQTQPKDTIKAEERRSNQNVLLNASSTSIPRAISLGLPAWATQIMEDGLPASFFADFFPGYWSWRSGLGTQDMQLTRLDESAILLGSAGFFPMSISKTGAEKLEGKVAYTLDQHGRHEIEVNIASPLGKGWGMNLNVYQNFNPGSNHLDYTSFQERIQYYKAGISKTLPGNKGLFQTTYLYMKTLDLSDPYGPFYFVGDGSVKPFEDFRLGKDQYIPATTEFSYLDVRTGKMEKKSYTRDLGVPVHVFTANLNYNLADGLSLEANTRVRFQKAAIKETYLGGITTSDGSQGFTYVNGTPYIGNVQSRMQFFYDDECNEWLNTLQLNGKSGRHNWTLGANAWIDWSTNYVMTSNFAYEATKNPKALTYNGEMFYIHNTAAQYMKGAQSRWALYARENWNITDRLTLNMGVRAEYSHIGGQGAYNDESQHNNDRTQGWSIQSVGVQVKPFQRNEWNGAASLAIYQKLNSRFGLELNAIATLKHAELWQFTESSLPSDKSQPNYLLRGGINYKNSWLDLQSLLTYIRQDNNYYSSMWMHELTKDAGGYPKGYTETIYQGSVYSMQALGWTTDMVLSPFPGFSFHGLFTFRAPTYRNYTFHPVFSDGYEETYDFSGKTISNTASVEVELEPSYSWKKWRWWLSARYYGKKYINITNSLYLNPRWETFGGVDFNWNEHMSISLNVVNFMNQKGASAGMEVASLATDVSSYRNYLTSGSYIRPFTIELSTKLSF